MFVELLKDLFGHKVGARIDIHDNDAKALIEAGSVKPVAGDPLGDIVTKAMGRALEGITGGLNKAVDSTLDEFAKARTLSRKGAARRIYGEGAELADTKKSFGNFLLSVRANDRKSLEDMGSRYVDWQEGVEKKTAMSTQPGAQGGYLVPIDFYGQLMQLVTERSIVRPRATIIPMAHRSCQVPALDVTTAPAAGDTAFLGGVVARWTEEATTINETEPNLKQVDLVNYELSGYSKVSNTLLQDSAIGLEAFLMQLFSRAIAWYEDYAFLRGNGVAKPLGVQTWAGLLSATRTTANQFKLADVATMYSRLLPGGDESTICWVVHPTVLAQLV